MLTLLVAVLLAGLRSVAPVAPADAVNSAAPALVGSCTRKTKLVNALLASEVIGNVNWLLTSWNVWEAGETESNLVPTGSVLVSTTLGAVLGPRLVTPVR